MDEAAARSEESGVGLGGFAQQAAAQQAAAREANGEDDGVDDERAAAFLSRALGESK